MNYVAKFALRGKLSARGTEKRKNVKKARAVPSKHKSIMPRCTRRGEEHEDHH